MIGWRLLFVLFGPRQQRLNRGKILAAGLVCELLAESCDLHGAGQKLLAVVELEADREVPLELTYQSTGGGTTLGGADVTMLTVQLNVAPVIDEQAEFERAVNLAAESDTALVVVGTNEEVESEGFDRTSLALPGRQDELVSAVAAANPRTIVVVNSGAPVLLPWANEVAAVLVSWFPGQEFGNAVCDVLTGVVEPGGRLPMTWPSSTEDLPSVTPVNTDRKSVV